MKNFTLKSFLFAFVAIAFITTFSACKKKSDDPSNQDPSLGYPKDVTITYKVSRTTGKITGAEMTYIDERGAEVNTGLVEIPWEVTFKKRVNYGDEISIIAGNYNYNQVDKGLKAEILVDGNVVANAISESGPTGIEVSAGTFWKFGYSEFVKK